jgi:hypothetical protein
MLVDAMSRRGVSRYWYFIILMPFGEVFYFFKYKIHDPDMAWLKSPFAGLLVKPLTIDELRFNMEQSPSVANKVALAQALYEEDQYREAASIFSEALRQDESSSEILYGLAVSHIGLNELEDAVEALKKLVEIDPKYSEYDGWAKLALALWETGRRQEALDVLSRLVSSSPRIQHRMLYAYYLGKNGVRGKAQEELVTAIREFEYSPRYLKRRNQPFVKQAKEMLQRLSIS